MRQKGTDEAQKLGKGAFLTRTFDHDALVEHPDVLCQLRSNGIRLGTLVAVE